MWKSRIWNIFGITLCIFLTFLTFVIASSESPARRTVMIYMVGGDLESDFHHEAGSRNIQAMLNSGADLESTNVVIAAGGTRQWRMLGLTEGEMTILQLTQAGNTISYATLSPAEKRDMAAPETLTLFLQTAMEACPAENYDLILWNHGGGPLLGYGLDEISGHAMELSALTRALEDAGVGKETRLEMIGFDDCLMGSVEVAAMVAPYADYMVASEENTNGGGWDYTFLGAAAMLDEDPLPMMREICEGYAASIYIGDYTISAVQLDQIARVSDALNQLLRDYPLLSETARGRAILARSVDNARAFSRFSSRTNLDLYDLWGFAEQVNAELPDSCVPLMQALEDAICVNSTNIPGAKGLSFYYPAENEALAAEYLVLYRRELTPRGYAAEYTRLLAGLIEGGQGGISTTATAGREETATIPVYAMELSAEQLDLYVRGFYLILAQEEGTENQYRLVESSRDVQLTEEGYLQAERESKVYRIRASAEDKWLEPTLIEQEREGTAAHYWTEATLTRFLNPQTLETLVQNVEVQIEAENENVSILQLVPDTESGLAPRLLMDLQSDDTLTFFQMHRVLTRDDDGNILPFQQWKRENENIIHTLEMKLKDQMPEIEYVEMGEEVQYYLQLGMIDVDGNVVVSELLPMN